VKYNLENESVGEEDQENKASNETMPRRSGQKAFIIVREEQANKDIMLGSQQTLPKMVGHVKTPKGSRGNVAYKGVLFKTSQNNDYGLLELQGFR